MVLKYGKGKIDYEKFGFRLFELDFIVLIIGFDCIFYNVKDC